MIKHLGFSPVDRAGIVKIPERVLNSIELVAENLDITEEGSEIDYRPFEWLLIALGSMSKAELYQAIKRLDSMSSIFSSEETSPNLKSANGKLELVFEK